MSNTLFASTPETRIAAIDVGTNSIHMVVVAIDPLLKTFRIIAREKDTVRLGETGLKPQELSPEAISRAIPALRRCQDLALSFQVESILAAATSATREAPNGQAFLQQVKDELNLSIDLISGQEEARRIYLGVLSGMDLAVSPHLVIDIGGGSTELILAEREKIRYLSSTKVGAVRLTRSLITTDPISSSEFNNLIGYIRDQLKRPLEDIRDHLQPGEIPQLIGTSGTIETLATVYALETQGSVPSPLNGFPLPLDYLQDLVKRLAKRNYAERLEIAGLIDKRAEIILAGAVILQEVMKILQLPEVVICERALREGMIVDWMLSHRIIEDRLQYQDRVRERSTLKIARKYRVNLDYSRKVADFAVLLFDQTHGQLHHWGENERELLWCGAFLHNVGIFVSHSSHHKHSYYLIRHAELYGFTESEVEVMAQIARYHRKSKPKKKHEAFNALSKLHRDQVSQLSAILRIAVALDRRQVGAIATLDVKFDERDRRLSLGLSPKFPGDACELEVWNLNFRKDVFEEEFEVTVSATVLPSDSRTPTESDNISQLSRI
ncbi:MAG: Ppx/GppA phosphatase family protein [Cyanobacteria bacterium P01_H01_bin.15]